MADEPGRLPLIGSVSGLRQALQAIRANRTTAGYHCPCLIDVENTAENLGLDVPKMSLRDYREVIENVIARYVRISNKSGHSDEIREVCVRLVEQYRGFLRRIV